MKKIFINSAAKPAKYEIDLDVKSSSKVNSAILPIPLSTTYIGKEMDYSDRTGIGTCIDYLTQKYLVKKGSEGETADGTEYSFKYTGEATTLTLSWTAKQYIHKIVVYNVLDFLEKEEATGYFMVPAGDVASFLMALVQAQAGDKIFLPNGTYDLGETVLTTISKNNISFTDPGIRLLLFASLSILVCFLTD